MGGKGQKRNREAYISNACGLIVWGFFSLSQLRCTEDYESLMFFSAEMCNTQGQISSTCNRACI